MSQQLELALIAANRFGLGARPGELNDIAHDPKDWVLAQLESPPKASEALTKLPSSLEYQKQFIEWHDQIKQAGKDKASKPRKFGDQFQSIMLAEINLRATLQCETTSPVAERLVMFWSNHFALSNEKRPLQLMAGTLEREVVRESMLGNFETLLIAAEQHPAMLMYLDNQQSTGADSPVSMKSARQQNDDAKKIDINENLAREILELHTLSSEGGYSQEDIIALARGITGWRPWVAARKGEPMGQHGSRFAPAFHEPGSREFLGELYKQEGVAQGEAMLARLANDPNTAHFISEKLCRHFVSDSPPKELVNTVSKAYIKNKGYLQAVYQTLFKSDLAWRADARKFRRPDEFLIAIHRALDTRPIAKQPARWRREMNMLGQDAFRPGSPAGWPDTASQWIGPDAIWKRLFVAQRYDSRLPREQDPMELARDSIGPRLSDATAVAISEASNRRQATALVLASPEFQWR